ncbi:MAG: MmcQ/YjbR family DNA-binding protein [Actinobacteria bacterium]|nr:MAG: MmcQ/YjbR family DNA-binding protein [Actinomycetota bacterium]
MLLYARRARHFGRGGGPRHPTTLPSVAVTRKRPQAGPLERLRAICMYLPEVTERLSHGAPTWFVRDKSVFVTYWEHGHHGNLFPHLWCAAPPGIQQELVAAEPQRFFRPPYVGGRGWLGMRLDVDLDWDEVAGVCEDAYRVIAPKRLVAVLEERSPR